MRLRRYRVLSGALSIVVLLNLFLPLHSVYSTALTSNPLKNPLSTVTWKDVAKTAAFDPIDDQQSSDDSDLLGNASNAMLQASKASVTVNSSPTTAYYYKARLGTLANGNVSTSFYLGLDLDGDSSTPVADVFVEANVSSSNGTYSISYHKSDPTKDGLSPSTTSWLNSATDTAVEEEIYTQTKGSYSGNNGFVDTVVSGNNYVLPSASNDLDSDGQTDKYVTFGFTWASLKAFAARAYPTRFANLQATDTVVLFTFTSTSQTSNGDIGGVDDQTADLTKTWAQLGVTFTSTLDNIATGSPAKPVVNHLVTADTTPTVTGTANLKSGDQLKVVINSVQYVYSFDGNAGNDTITLTPINGDNYTWTVNVTSALPTGTYDVDASITRSGTIVTDASTSELVISNNPTVSGIAITSSAGSDNTYAEGDDIQATVTFSSAVDVTGTPTLKINVGGTLVNATYVSGSGTANIVFKYTVVQDDLDLSGVSIPSDALALSGGTIYANGTTNAAVIKHSPLTDNPLHMVDAVKPVPLSAEAYQTQLDIYFTDDMNLKATNGATTGRFLVMRKPAGGSLATVAVSAVATTANPRKVTLTLASPISPTDEVMVSYVDATSNNDATGVTQDIAGNDTASFTMGVKTDDLDAIVAAIEQSGKNSGDYNNDDIQDRMQPGFLQVPLTNATDFASRSISSADAKFGAVAVGTISEANKKTALVNGSIVKLTANARISAMNLRPIAQATGTGRSFSTPASDIYEVTVIPDDGTSLVDVDPTTTGKQVRIVIDLPEPVTADTYMKKKLVGTSVVWFPFLDDQNLTTYDNGATLVTDSNGDVTRVVVTMTDGSVGDYDKTINDTIMDLGYLAVTDKKVHISMSDTQLTKGQTSLVTFCFANQVTGFSNSDIVVQNGTLGTLSSAVVNTDGTVCYTATFTPTANISDATNVISVLPSSYTYPQGQAGTGGTSPNYTIYTKGTTLPNPLVGPLDMTDDTDSGASPDDEITSNGLPKFTLTGQSGLTFELYGPTGTKLTLGKNYTVNYLNGIYGIALTDAVAGGTVNKFGKYSFGGLTGNPAATSDGTYTIKALNGFGQRATVGSFKINTAMLATKRGTHKAYIKGYTDGTFRGEQNINRAEMAAILYRTVSKAKIFAIPTYTDVPTTFWGYKEITTVSQMGLMSSKEANKFLPDGSITRAEFASIVSRLIGPPNPGTVSMTDVDASHWAYTSIKKMLLSGIMSSYPDGSFRPMSYMTRAEVVTVYNKYLNRGPLQNVTTSTWSDVNAQHWAAKDIEEASTDHDFSIKSDLKEYLK